MKMFTLSTLVLLTVPALAAPAAAAPVVDPPPTLVARYNFDGGATAGKISDLSGRGSSLTVRGADNGTVAINTEGAGRYAAFPAVCPATGTCGKALLEAPNDADLNPGTRNFRWAASVRVTQAQLHGKANVMQKGLAGADSVWKLQLTGKTGRAQCAMTGKGTGQTFTATSARPLADGSWHKIVCERTATSLSISVDGNPGSRTTIPATLSVDNTMPLRIGGPNFGASSDMYHGQLDDVYIQLG
ncbi:LamG domain-containing protein [Actinoplanes oblitus]|uniref:LamG domain-containing protein n=1 Tax=Actinoplanes oblitus TaxID=3040509 RepID=A0ABY8W7S2_9ACTN|nr:LamG-like jellyroll fold domain-containing protein [Actinoplanes oblitus]WIM93865.1 LamG domain-containing protein [Actinoplanes oblitus]